MPDELAMLFSLRGKQGFFLFKETEIKPDEINLPDETTEFKTDKTQAQRIRSALYVLWDQTTDKRTDFDTFYKAQTERIISWIKDKLE